MARHTKKEKFDRYIYPMSHIGRDFLTLKTAILESEHSHYTMRLPSIPCFYAALEISFPRDFPDGCGDRSILYNSYEGQALYSWVCWVRIDGGVGASYYAHTRMAAYTLEYHIHDLEKMVKGKMYEAWCELKRQKNKEIVEWYCADLIADEAERNSPLTYHPMVYNKKSRKKFKHLVKRAYRFYDTMPGQHSNCDIGSQR